MNMFASQTMGTPIKYIVCLSVLIIKLSLIHGYDSRTNFRMIDILKRQLETVMADLKYVKEDLQEERVKSVILEKQLNALKGGSQGILFNDKDSKQEVDTRQSDPEQRVYNALYDEKQERKVFENLVKSVLKDEKVNMEMKIASINKTLTANIDTQLNTLQDEVLYSVTELNDYIASIKELTSNVKQNENSITRVQFESEQHTTTLLIHDALLVSLNDSLMDVEVSIVELNDSCHNKGWSVWSNWSTCGKSCGVGLQTSTRTCGSTNTLLSGKCCIGTDTKTQVCTLPSCPAKDCLELLNKKKHKVNGVYNVTSPSSGLVYPVYCDMTTDGGGWTVFQKRFDGRLDFYRTFKEYENGFGDVNAEFWMGLNRIHDMTAHHETELRIHLTAADGSTAYQTFQDFSVSPGSDYRLRVGKRAGTVGDGYGLNTNGMRFSTKDKDVDGNSYGKCADRLHGGWWYKKYSDCSNVNLNGDYGTPGTWSSYDYGWGGVIYYSFKKKQSLKTTSMMFRRK